MPWPIRCAKNRNTIVKIHTPKTKLAVWTSSTQSNYWEILVLQTTHWSVLLVMLQRNRINCGTRCQSSQDLLHTESRLPSWASVPHWTPKVEQKATCSASRCPDPPQTVVGMCCYRLIPGFHHQDCSCSCSSYLVAIRRHSPVLSKQCISSVAQGLIDQCFPQTCWTLCQLTCIAAFCRHHSCTHNLRLTTLKASALIWVVDACILENCSHAAVGISHPLRSLDLQCEVMPHLTVSRTSTYTNVKRT